MMYSDKIFVFDDIIDKEYQKKIQQILFNKTQWQFIADVTNPHNTQQRPGFSHHFVQNKNEVSKINQDLLPMVIASARKIGFKHTDILQGRSFLQVPLNLKDRSIDVPHIDADIPHLVVLYYVNDSDGETVIYENKFQSIDKVPRFNELTEKQRVQPKAGRVVLFDGHFWHTSCQPEHNVRCIVNYNVV